MPGYFRIAFPLLLTFGTATTALAQEDLSRERGLPTRIGGSRCDGARPGSNATVQGSFNVSGMQNSEKPPKFSVALYAAGVFISRQRVKNGGTFYFYCVPDQGVMVAAEVDSTEVSSYSMGTLARPPQTNYQDIYVSWSEAGKTIKQRNEVISARDAYERTPENQKSFEKGIEQLQAKKLDAARKSFEQLLAKDANDYVTWTELGNIQFNQNQFDDAITSYDKALALEPDFGPALYGNGRANLSAKKMDRSIELLARAEAMSPNSADIHHYLGEAYLQNKKGSLAITEMRKAMELAPDAKADLHLRIGWLYDAAGGKNLAAEEYKQLLQKKPDHPMKPQLLKYINENSQK